MLQYKLKITGVVQGVGFRYFVRQEAARLELEGAVWNCPDGSVEI
ncbi:MAG: acylphosphatase, partial [Proteobacteria bacterium]|nr:acylphosphatase [Pseudomonadota bacterium]